MLMGVIADDLTGATDVAVNLRAAGLSVVQINGVPREDLAIDPFDAVVVALKSRTSEMQLARAQSLASLAWLQARGARRIYFKYCSTFDSTPRGNIGPVTDALADALDAAVVAATPAYPRNQRTVYLGHLFVGDLLLSDTGMRHHPLTPMTDANLVRVLQAQTTRRVGLLPLAVVTRGPAAISERLQALRDDGVRHAIADATEDAHLHALGAALLDAPLSTGGAGLASGLAQHLAARARPAAAGPRHVAGPMAILAGSCSAATLAQLAHVPVQWPQRRLDVAALIEGSDEVGRVLDWARSQLARAPVVISASAPPEELAQTQQRYGRERAAGAVEAALAALATGLARAGVRRFVVAGGETSGAVVDALAREYGLQALVIGAEIAPGVPWTVTADGEPFALALKSGNFGGPDFFLEATRRSP